VESIHHWACVYVTANPTQKRDMEEISNQRSRNGIWRHFWQQVWNLLWCSDIGLLTGVTYRILAQSSQNGDLGASHRHSWVVEPCAGL